jgi:hypothetical protein
MKLSNGWSHINGPVWDHKNGTRIHVTASSVRLPDGATTGVYADRARVNRLIKMTGGNRKRGVMAYAELLYKEGCK